MKKLLILISMLALSACIIGCGGNETKKPESETEVPSAVAENDEPVTMVDNFIYNTKEGENGEITVEKYTYEDDVLSGVEVTIKLEDEKAAKEMYESITSGELKEEYDKKYENVELKDNSITANVKEENVEGLKALAQDEMYLILNSAITTYEIKE